MREIIHSDAVRELVQLAVTTAILTVIGLLKKKSDLKKLRKSGKLRDGK